MTGSATTDDHAIAAALFAMAVASAFLVGSWLAVPGRFAISPAIAVIVVLLTAATIQFLFVAPRQPYGAIGAALLCSFVGLRFASELGYAIYFHSQTFALADARLAMIDRAMGVDWPRLIAWFDRHPAITGILRVAYEQCPLFSIGTIVALAIARHMRRLYVLIAADFAALAITHIVALMVPAIGAYGYYHLGAAAHPRVLLFSVDHTVADVLAMRSSTQFVLPTHPLLGLITFPSYHAVIAVHLGWALWPFRRVRVPVTITAFAILVSTVPHGSHHVIDVIAGIIVAIITLWGAQAATTRFERSYQSIVGSWQRGLRHVRDPARQIRLS